MLPQDSLSENGTAEPPSREPQRELHEEPMLYCPVCSQRLAEMKCKLVCRQCGYYMSCADYY